MTHVDSDAPLLDSNTTGELITDQLWGIYYKPDFNFAGPAGRRPRPTWWTSPRAHVAIDPYGPESPEFTGDRRLRADVDVGAGALP